ncbi:MAG: hypothetical protein GF419_10960 [Ignavibacteriales bacterium]|nr:hypothetical protein [Ignavibacteriales bacterium]
MDVTRSNNMVNFHLVGRFIVPMKSFRPYFDVYGGGNYLWTQTTIEERYSSGNDDDDEIASDVNLDDFAWSYGVGGGIQILISDDESTRVYIDLKARQLWGTKAEYLREGDIVVDDSVLPPEVYYYVNYTETDMFTVLLGISVQTGL